MHPVQKATSPIWHPSLEERDETVAYVQMQSRVFLVPFVTLGSHTVCRAAEGEPAVHLAAKQIKQILGCTCKRL